MATDALQMLKLNGEITIPLKSVCKLSLIFTKTGFFTPIFTSEDFC